MAMLRKTIQLEVMEILDNSFFTSDDFVIDYESDNANLLIHIQFKYDEAFYFNIEKHNNAYYTRKSPGNIEQVEFTNCGSFSTAIGHINNWCTEVRNELKANKPVYKEIDELRKIIEEHIVGENGEEEFSVEEINILRKKFDELNARVEKLEETQIITNKQKQEFTAGVSQVSEDLEYYPKSTWIKTASSKLVNLMTMIGRSKEGRKLLEEGARKLIGLE